VQHKDDFTLSVTLVKELLRSHLSTVVKEVTKNETNAFVESVVG